jgi:gliding motility-associated-like protein
MTKKVDMNKIFTLLLFSCFTNCYMQAQQNLVPNPGFEIKTQCCDRIAGCVTSWSQTPGSDTYYFNTCNPLDFSVPHTFAGIDYQQAKTGSAFAGVKLYASFPFNRDYLTVTLNDSLRRGETYTVEFYVAVSTFGMHAVDRIGMYISSAPVTKSGLEGFIYTPQIENATGVVLKDSLNWTKISGSYKAKGGEKYIAIGNFYSDALTTHLQLMPFSKQEMALYFIDDVSVKKYEEPSVLVMPSSFTPNGDGKNDIFKPDETSKITSGTMTIYSRWGNVVCKTENLLQGWDGTADKKECPSGVYYYIVKYTGTNGEVEESKGNVTLLR